MRRVLVIRYGGLGDVCQASSILPHLKADGWHVTFDTSDAGFEMLREDPLVDQILLTPTGSVPLDRLGEYWNARSNGFERVINLTESVENGVLPFPTIMAFFHDDETRRRLYGKVSYLERIHQIAGTAGPYIPRFYLTEDEKEAAARRAGSLPALVLALSGSSEYKVWPHQPEFVRKLLQQSNATVFLAGGASDEHLADGIRRHIANTCPEFLSRVVDMTTWPVRSSFALACVADCVVGPETGVINAAASYPVRKIVILSHSSPENLVKFWPNTHAISPSVPCHPCHRLHRTQKFCPRGPSGQFAACAERVSPDEVLAASIDAIKRAA